MPFSLLQHQDGRTPLHYACSCGHRDIARILLDKGANLEATADVSSCIYSMFLLYVKFPLFTTLYILVSMV